MKLIGITGPTGAGKTTALNALKDLGACILDADAVYYELLERDEGLKKELRERFGDGILNGSGGIDRKKLGNLVFEDPAALAALNAIAHRHVLWELESRVEDARRREVPAVAIDAIALIESGAGKTCDAIVSILAPPEVRLGRIMARDGISEEYARKRVAAQQPDDFYRANSDYVLENDKSEPPEAFARRARALFEQIMNV